jgi:GntR family transcriptional regulator, transcriptional repressor for pyruvate dehydrogenase complex
LFYEERAIFYKEHAEIKDNDDGPCKPDREKHILTPRAKGSRRTSKQLSPIVRPILGGNRLALTQQVIDVLAERIVSGEFPERSLLPSEKQLCESLGVSRPVVREAIKALQSQGLVRIERGRGTVVQEPHFGPLTDALKMLVRRRAHMLDDLLEIRKILEVHMVMRAAERRSEANLNAMERFVEKMRTSPNEPEGYVNADLDFHTEIARATQNPILLVLLEPIADLSRESRETTFLGPKMVQLRRKQHEEILECIRRRDAEGARTAMSRHLAGTERDLHKRIALRPSTKSPR